uniref:Uncharacterized protein n=1 Tax=Aegilops tauschii TaxID=37682 RepID=R7W9P9_AEGTA
MDLDTAVAIRAVKATSAAAHAVTTCDPALLHARGIVAPGNDDAAALAALDASRCAAASLAALEVATHCAASTSAAQQARAAAARCATDGAAAAAFAGSCVAACGDAAILTSAAREAAARCVLARDDATTAELVARQVPTWPDLASSLAHDKAARESAKGHKKACGDEAAVAAAAARQAADRCVAADADVVQAAAGEVAACLAVPLADAAAVKAREAAANCDAALADSSVADADKDDFLDKMRGWVMTVARSLWALHSRQLLIRQTGCPGTNVPDIGIQKLGRQPPVLLHLRLQQLRAHSRPPPHVCTCLPTRLLWQ